jgi:hypothetical protein
VDAGRSGDPAGGAGVVALEAGVRGPGAIAGSASDSAAGSAIVGVGYVNVRKP